MRYEFSDFELDEAAWELRRAGRRVELATRPLELLWALLQNRHRLVPRSELERRLWPDVRVSVASLATCLKELRRALGDDGSSQQLIRTVRGKGYRFVGPVREVGVAAATHDGGAGLSRLVTGVPFVGRRDVMGRLEAALDAARAGRGRGVLLAGEAGIGKTRTIYELGAAAATSGARFLTGGGLEGDGVPPYRPWVEILRGAFASLDDEELPRHLHGSGGTLAMLVPELADRILQLPMPARLEPDEARFRLFDAVTRFLSSLARPSGLVLAFDDLHWADAGSLRLLEVFARMLSSAPLLLLGAYRDVEVDRAHPLSDTLARLVRNDAFERLSLSGLERAEVATLVQALTGDPPGDRALERIVAQTDGNPFYVGELVRFRSRRELKESDAGADAPMGIRLALRQRLCSLSPECDGLLAAASVIDREFSLELAARMSGLPDPAARRASEEARHAGFLEEMGPGRWRFIHALTQEAVYAELSHQQRAEQHGRAADELLRRGATERFVDALAHHLAAAGRDADASKFARRAADAALEQLAFEVAARLYASALASLDRVGGGTPLERCDLLLAQAEALKLSAGEYAARSSALEAAALARDMCDGVRLARAALAGTGARENRGWHDKHWTELLREALATIADHSLELRVPLLIHLAAQRSAAGALDEARALNKQAVRTARQAGAPRSLSMALAGPMRSADPSEREGDAREALRLAIEVSDPACEAAARRVHAGALLELGRYEESRIEGELWRSLAERFQIRQELATACAFASVMAHIQGRLDDAEKLAAEALHRRQELGDPNAREVYIIQIFLLRRDQGRLGELHDAARQFVQHSVSAAVGWRAALAWLLAHLHQEDEARLLLSAFVDEDLPRIHGEVAWFSQAVVAAETCALLGDRERAGRLYQLLYPFRDEVTVVNWGDACAGPVNRTLGLLAAARSRWDESIAHLEAAASSCEGAAPTWWAHCQYDLGKVLLERGRPEDRSRAQLVLDASRACARELGLHGLLSEAEV